jgi:signal transduction histidine kinase
MIQKKMQLEPAELRAAGVRRVVDPEPAAGRTREGRRAPLDRRVTGPVLVDLARMQQVVCNLLSNAIKFSRSGGTVEVEVVDEQDWSRCGCEIMAREFLRVPTPRLRTLSAGRGYGHSASGGLGLGLAIVRHLVDLHGAPSRRPARGWERARSSPCGFRSRSRSAVKTVFRTAEALAPVCRARERFASRSG